jgi:hypothetical protein
MDEVPENGKELSHSAYANGMNVQQTIFALLQCHTMPGLCIFASQIES